MLNRFYQATFLSLVLAVSTDRVVFSLPLLPSPPYPVGQGSIGQPSQVQNVDGVNAPYCYMQTSDGRNLNLEKLCGTDSNSNGVPSIGQSSTSNQTPSSGQSSMPPQSARPASPLRLGSGWGYAADAEGR
jgi:hypothetical protein